MAPAPTASEKTFGFAIPLLTAVQFCPLSDERKIPANVPAKSVSPATASALTLAGGLKTAVQSLPLSIDRKMPILKPTKRVVPFMASARTLFILGKPALAGVQVCPLCGGGNDDGRLVS